MTDRSLAARLEAWLNPLPTCALMAGLQLDVFTHLSRRPSTASELAAALGVDERRLSQLLRALSAVDLLHISLDEETAPGDSHRAYEAVYHAGEEVTALLSTDSSRFIGQDHALAHRFMRTGTRLATAIRTGK
ncbi:MAG: methyltransferase dimerization domain-containing protein, partial [Candidatus Latescibacterota bacterium]|nr:methyltransferase dimerization domain-containing protein [Candidatus Latescibacterota bacterium]